MHPEHRLNPFGGGVTTQAAVDRTETFAELFRAICDNIETAIRGKREEIFVESD